MKYLSIILLVILSACGKAPNPAMPAGPGGPGVPASKPTATPTPPPITPPVDGGPTVPPISLTFYQLTKTIATSGGISLQATAGCIVYTGNTYCWDDGIKTIAGQQLTYWGMNNAGQTCPNVHGGCTSDLLGSPLLMNANVKSVLDSVQGSAHRTTAEVFSTGTSIPVLCALTGASLNCVNFVIDLGRLSL